MKNSPEALVVFDLANNLHLSLQQVLLPQARWDQGEVAQALFRLQVYCDVLQAIESRLKREIFEGVRPAEKMALRDLIREQVLVYAGMITKVTQVVQAVARADAARQEVTGQDAQRAAPVSD